MEDILKFTGHDAQWGILSYKKWFKNWPNNGWKSAKNGSKSVKKWFKISLYKNRQKVSLCKKTKTKVRCDPDLRVALKPHIGVEQQRWLTLWKPLHFVVQRLRQSLPNWKSSYAKQHKQWSVLIFKKVIFKVRNFLLKIPRFNRAQQWVVFLLWKSCF